MPTTSREFSIAPLARPGRRTRLLLAAAWLLPVLAACGSGDPSESSGASASGVTSSLRVAQHAAPVPALHETASPAITEGELMPYHGGPIMTGTVHLYYIWYGQWNDDAPASIILPAFGALVGGSPYLNVLSTYKTPAGATAATQATLAGGSSDSGSQGLFLDDSHTAAVVSHAITTGALPSDTNGIYVVLGGSNVNFVDLSVGQLCTTMCGYHQSTTVNGAGIRYAFVGSPNFCFATGQAATSGAPGCAWSSTAANAAAAAPHGDSNADPMVTSLAHEIAEAITDPVPGSGFYDANAGEAADLCISEWGPTFSVNGSATQVATVSFPTQSGNLPPQNFLLMPVNANLGNGFCAMDLPKAPTCSFSQACVDSKGRTSISCTGVTGDINASLVFQRDGVTFSSLVVDNLDPTQPYSATDTQPGAHAYRVCTSNANGKGSLLCTSVSESKACPACTPKKCVRFTCGEQDDGCGGTITCAGCPAKFACVDGTCELECIGKVCQ